MLSYNAMPCHAMPCHAMPCHAMPCHAMPYHAMPCHAMPYHAIPYHHTDCPITHLLRPLVHGCLGSGPGDESFSLSSSVGSVPAGLGAGGSIGSIGSGPGRPAGGSYYYSNGEPKKGPKGRGKMSEAAARHLNSGGPAQAHGRGGGGMTSVSASMINELQKEFFGRL